jgi:hypothetical protein
VDAIDALWRKTAHHAWVETEAGGRVAAQSVIAYSGDAHTVWIEPIQPGVETRHQAAVSDAIARRHRTLRLISVALRVLTTIAAVSSNPVLAIPALLNGAKLASELRQALEAA